MASIDLAVVTFIVSLKRGAHGPRGIAFLDAFLQDTVRDGKSFLSEASHRRQYRLAVDERGKSGISCRFPRIACRQPP